MFENKLKRSGWWLEKERRRRQTCLNSCWSWKHNPFLQCQCLSHTAIDPGFVTTNCSSSKAVETACPILSFHTEGWGRKKAQHSCIKKSCVKGATNVKATIHRKDTLKQFTVANSVSSRFKQIYAKMSNRCMRDLHKYIRARDVTIFRICLLLSKLTRRISGKIKKKI